MYLQRKIPNIEHMFTNDAFTENDIIGSWDVLRMTLDDIIAKSTEEATEPDDNS